MQDIFNFIKTKNPNLKRVVRFEVKDVDDDNGCIGEHYIVTCLLNVIKSTSNDIKFEVEEEKICLIDIREFKKWLRGDKSIKWMD